MIYGEYTEGGVPTNVYAEIRVDGRTFCLDVDKRHEVVVLNLGADRSAFGGPAKGKVMDGVPVYDAVAHSLFEALGTVLGRTFEKRKEQS
jgi:hypothetical protein